MKRLSAAVAALILLLVSAPAALAIGTPAGTDITSQATVVYTFGGSVYTLHSNIVTTTVIELLDVDVVWQDAAPVPVYPGAAAEILTFRLTNTGNGTDSYALDGLSALAGDDFDPLVTDIYLDRDGDGVLIPAIDTLYLPGTNDPQLPADGWVNIFVLNDIPVSVTEGQRGDCQFTASSTTGTGAPGTVIPGGGEAGVDAMIGTSGGSADQIGSYRVAAIPVELIILKSAIVNDASGGTEPVAGATITYTLTVATTGVATALGVVITDAIPAHTTYNPNTLTLNGGALTDTADADVGDVAGTTPDTVTVDLGDLVVGAPVQVIAFTVTID